ncbi:MAG: hypothetical protein HY282_18000 [Nitrospirae bacterium]|nr:hypothetical protein [Candidatus Manganitrophaceae bacterium]
MGTSGPSNGPNPRTPLVPSWLDDGPGAVPADGDSEPPDSGQPDNPGQSQPLPPLPPAPPPGRFTSSRRNFSIFTGSGGSDHRALRRAVRDYVRSGMRGSGNATRRMGASRTTARGVLGVLRDFQREGVNPTLARLNLSDLAGRPLEHIFIGLTDVICGDGGSIDEGIAREAWLETIAELDGLDVADPAALPPDQIRDIFLTFIAHSVVGRLLQDIGANGFKFAVDLASIAEFDAQLKSYIRRSVRDSFSGDLSAPATLSDQQVRAIVNQT